jgi:DNA-binding response OmpR family regulator
MVDNTWFAAPLLCSAACGRTLSRYYANMPRQILVAAIAAQSSAQLDELFSSWGCRCTIAADCTAAASLLSNQQFDLAVVDFNLSHDAAERIIREIKLKEIPTPVIVIADNCAETELTRIERTVRALGADFFFVRPFEKTDFRAVCNNLFAVRDTIAGGAISD